MRTFRIDSNKHIIVSQLFALILSMLLFSVTDVQADSVLVVKSLGSSEYSMNRKNLSTGDETLLKTFTSPYGTCAGCSFVDEYNGKFYIGGGSGFAIYDVETNEVTLSSKDSALLYRQDLWNGDTIIKTGTDSDDGSATTILGSLDLSDSSGNTLIERASNGTTSIGTNSDNGAATIITKGTANSAEISDGNGKTIIKRAADGSLHIGENSLVTKEENGKQSLSAQDANGDAIDINITNGSNLLINGKPITAGVSIKEVRKYDSRSVALSAALTSLPTQSIDGSHTCGIGSGVRGNYSAMALGCAADLDKIKLFDNAPLFIRNASINLGTSFLTHDDPDYTFKAGLTWSFGKSKANTRNLSKNDRRDIRSTIAEQKNALAINKLQKDNRVLKESNLALTRKLNSLVAANQRFVSLASKMELLAHQLESSELVLASK